MTTPRKILIVDDEQHILQVLALKLRNAGYLVVTAVDGEDGFEAAGREGPDLIIADFQMPYMTGVELARALAGEPRTAGIPILLLTARGYALDEKDLHIGGTTQAGGIRDVLTKPFSPRAIVAQVDALLAEPERPRTEPATKSCGSGGGAAHKEKEAV